MAQSRMEYPQLSRVNSGFHLNLDLIKIPLVTKLLSTYEIYTCILKSIDCTE